MQADAARPTATRPGVAAFRGLGTWVDVYDYGPNFQGSPNGPPAVTEESVDDMAKLGVKTIYLQASQDDTRSEGTIVDRRLVGDILRRAHRRGVRVVAWYLPHFEDVSRDLRHIEAMHDFRAGGQRFDGIALDVEWTNDVKDPVKRNRALLTLAKRTRRAVTDVPVGAIVLEPVLLEDINTSYWPDFPWKKLRPFVDVWLPMAYWTNRTDASGWNNGFRYTSENIRRVRRNVGDRNARRPCHRRDRQPDRGGRHGGVRPRREAPAGDRLVGVRLRHDVQQRLAETPRLTSPVLGTLSGLRAP